MRGRASLFFRPPTKCSTVQVDERGTARRMGSVTVQIEQVGRARVAVPDVGHSLDVATANEERPEQDAGERKTATKPRGQLGVDVARQPAPRPSLMALSIAGPACSPRQATTASPAVATTVTPNPTQPPGESMSP